MQVRLGAARQERCDEKESGLGESRTRPTGSRRHGRLETCATGKARRRGAEVGMPPVSVGGQREIETNRRNIITKIVAVLFVISLSHMLNDTIQALLPSIYPLLQRSFAQPGWITFTFQYTASLFQPLVGLITDKKPMPHSLAAGMGLTMAGLLALAFPRHWGPLMGARLETALAANE
jgi:hypothetical protein